MGSALLYRVADCRNIMDRILYYSLGALAPCRRLETKLCKWKQSGSAVNHQLKTTEFPMSFVAAAFGTIGSRRAVVVPLVIRTKSLTRQCSGSVESFTKWWLARSTHCVLIEQQRIFLTYHTFGILARGWDIQITITHHWLRVARFL